ncbi:MAG: PorV/PorQ family protein [Calditrichaeota bacterium]|nr:PorV/PorQ family protein [Calditrichota bacterium]
MVRFQRVGFRLIFLTALLVFTVQAEAQKPYRVGTTTANFLEVGYGSAGSAMGDAYVSVANDLSSIYWNPAGLAFMKQNEAQFSYQPWLVNINTSFTSVGLVLPGIGTLALGLIQVSYGDMDVTSLEMQEGTGEKFTAADYAFSLSYSRRITHWFSFGASAKYIASQIWHEHASAMALDLGVIVKTFFFSPTGKRADGLNIGMSISNYGTRMKYDGIDLTRPIDILPRENGNYADVPGQFKMRGWELPLLFRIGVSVNPIVYGSHRLTLAADALHPNNNSESVNVGAQYELTLPSAGTFYLRGGYKALFMDESQYGFTFGGGMTLRMMHNVALKLAYAYRGIGLLGKISSYSVGVAF